jgi:hypothetical protein
VRRAFNVRPEDSFMVKQTAIAVVATLVVLIAVKRFLPAIAAKVGL